MNLESKTIQGPVNFVYLVGDAGDDIQHKILLLGDYYGSKCTTPLKNSINITDFYQYIADRMSPTIVDVLIESTRQIGTEEKKGDYLQALYQDFEECLFGDCNKTMKVHYIDVKRITPELLSFGAIGLLLNYIRQNNVDNIKIWNKIRWPSESDRKDAINISLADAGISQERISKLSPKIQKKFTTKVVMPLFNKLMDFYKIKNNRDEFQQIQNIATRIVEDGILPNKRELAIITSFENKFISLQSYFMDVYFVAVILRENKPMTHILSYMGWAHVFHIRDILLDMEFSVQEEGDKNNLEERSIAGKINIIGGSVNQCLDYTSIKYAVNAFCTEEEEIDEEEEEMDGKERRELERELEIRLDEIRREIEIGKKELKRMEEDRAIIMSRLKDIRQLNVKKVRSKW